MMHALYVLFSWRISLSSMALLSWKYSYPEHIEYGIDSFGNCLEMFYAGGHCGRLVVDLEGDD